jgi:hypothetical protein
MKTKKGLYEAGKKFTKICKLPWDDVESSMEFQICCNKYNIDEEHQEFIKMGYLGIPFEEEDDSPIMPIRGNFYGQKLSTIPIKYLNWCLSSLIIQDLPELKQQIKHEIEKRK